MKKHLIIVTILVAIAGVLFIVHKIDFISILKRLHGG